MRILKSIAVCSCALFFTLVVLGNLVDYTSNFTAVIHVLSMDATFKNPEIMGRALTLPLHHHIAYWIIIFVESVAAIVLWVSALGMFVRRGQEISYSHFKRLAILGLFIGFILYFLGFIVIGGEWFCMWQSQQWNAVPTAAIFANTMMFVILFLNLSDD